MIPAQPPPEFARPLPLYRLGQEESEHTIEANATECAAIAVRLRLPAVELLSCRFALRRDGDRVAARGMLQARIVQECVVSLEPFETELREDFKVLFVPAGTERENENDPLAIDEVPCTAGVIDLGEAAVEQLALGLDPYPRRPGAALPEADRAAVSEHPFAGLAPRRPKR